MFLLSSDWISNKNSTLQLAAMCYPISIQTQNVYCGL